MHRLEGANVFCLKAFGAFLYFKLHCLAFVEQLVSVDHDRREVYAVTTSSPQKRPQRLSLHPPRTTREAIQEPQTLAKE
jgi:hypothetical protein